MKSRAGAGPPAAVTSVTLVTLVGLAGLLDSAGARCPGQCRCERKAADCSLAGLDAVPIFLDPRLHALQLQGNGVDSIADTLVFYPHLRELDLSNNSLRSLLEQQFVMQGELRQLRLQKNRVAKLMRATFEGLGRLQELDLSDNALTALEDGVFRWTERLRHLSLARNRVRLIARDAFENLSELTTLDLAENRLTHVPSDAFRHLGSLRALSLRHNSLQEVPFHAFFVLQSLRDLSLAGNSIYRIHPEAFTDLDELRRLDISRNELDMFPATSLALPQLEELDAGGNRFPALVVPHLDRLRSLRVLRLCGSRALAAVDGGVFENNLFLEEVYVCENPQLAWLPGTIVDMLPGLRVLDVSGNGLAVLENMTLPLRHVELFNASDNPLTCNCSARWLWELPDRVANASAVWPVVCADSGRPLAALDAAELGCGGWLAPLLVAAAAFVVVFCAAFVGLLLLRRRRRRERQLACVRDHCIRSYSGQWEDEPSDSDAVKEGGGFVRADPRYGSLSRFEHFTFHSPDYQKKIPVTVV